MIFTLEALRAKKGDALLLHVGDPEDPALMVIDGGPGGVYRSSLKPRLDALRAAQRDGGPLPIRLLMVSHIDDDHINGVLDLTAQLREEKRDRREPSYRIGGLWHNAFDDVVGNGIGALAEVSAASVDAAGLTDAFVSRLAVQDRSEAVLASVPQGRQLRDDARFLGVAVNAPFQDLILAKGDDAPVSPALVAGLETWVVGPRSVKLREFQDRWDEELRRRGLAAPEEVTTAAYLDDSAFNLASIVVLMAFGGKELLLTGDARGDEVLAGLEEAGLLAPGGSRHLHCLKLPHHGSDRNVEEEFFRRLPADHYVVSGDGSHGNPELETFRMLLAARRDDGGAFTVHLTYEPDEFRPDHGVAYPAEALRGLFAEARDRGQGCELVTPGAEDPSVKIDLLEPLAR
jgi:hypothetical protein